MCGWAWTIYIKYRLLSGWLLQITREGAILILGGKNTVKSCQPTVNICIKARRAYRAYRLGYGPVGSIVVHFPLPLEVQDPAVRNIERRWWAGAIFGSKLFRALNDSLGRFLY